MLGPVEAVAEVVEGDLGRTVVGKALADVAVAAVLLLLLLLLAEVDPEEVWADSRGSTAVVVLVVVEDLVGVEEVGSQGTVVGVVGTRDTVAGMVAGVAEAVAVEVGSRGIAVGSTTSRKKKRKRNGKNKEKKYKVGGE